MGNLPINGNLPIEAKRIPNIGWSNFQYRLQDLPVVGISTVFTLASIVCTYNHITVNVLYQSIEIGGDVCQCNIIVSLNGHMRLANLALYIVPVSIWVNNVWMVDMYITKHFIVSWHFY